MHYVFLDLRQTKWLEVVLRVAAGNDWTFPLVCKCSSKKHTISITKFHLCDSPVVKIYEQCQNGKIFFTLSAVDVQYRGWVHLLKALQEVVGISTGRKEGIRPKSYAQVLAKKGWSMEGRCRRMKFDSMEMINVDSPGVEDRVSFLKCCLVFRFEKVTVMNWVEFRTWVSRSWGVPVYSKILHIGDDVWMLVSDSEAEVQRILLLNCCKFNNIGILMDGWIRDAGRSNVCLESEVGWIMVRGIPLHLYFENYSYLLETFVDNSFATMKEGTWKTLELR
ncbi:hypothetical protein LINGRAHAP2_LOCUS22687 [Linum grandiflorum]